MFKKYKYFITAIIIILATFSYLMYNLRRPEKIFIFPFVPIHRPLSAVQPPIIVPPQTFQSLKLPNIEELEAKTTGWKFYENKKYNLRIKYPFAWNHEDESNSVIFKAGAELADYNAPMVFLTNKRFSESAEVVPEGGSGDATIGGVSIAVFYSDDLSKIPTKESIANDLKEGWSVLPEIKTFSLNEFEGAIAIGESTKEEGRKMGISGFEGARSQRGIAFRKLNNHIYYIEWGLDEEYQYSKTDYSDVTYQNQFLPFITSFEIII